MLTAVLPGCGVAYSRVRPTQVWRTVEYYSRVRGDCSLRRLYRAQKLPIDSMAAPKQVNSS